MTQPADWTRYTQQMKLSEIGIAGQERIQQASVLCVGAGGLAAPLLLYLAGAGVGRIGIVDDDVVELSNLHRQVIYQTQQVGRKKAVTAAEQIHYLNPSVTVEAHPQRMNADNAELLLKNYDIIADCSDNFTTRYLVNQTCRQLNKPLVFASVTAFQGQCTTFSADDASPCFQCLFPERPTTEWAPDCNQMGVLGAVPGLMGMIQATEVLKLILKIGQPLIGRLLCVDTLSMQFTTFTYQNDPDCRTCHHHSWDTRLTLSASALRNKINSGEILTMIDVRTVVEHECEHIGGLVIPLDQLTSRLSEISNLHTIVVYCQTGQRSIQAVDVLNRAGFEDVYSLEGGLKAWRNQSY